MQPIEAQSLLGQVRSIGRDGAGEAVSYMPAQLWRLPIVDPTGTTTLAADATIEVGLAEPSY